MFLKNEVFIMNYIFNLLENNCYEDVAGE